MGFIIPSGCTGKFAIVKLWPSTNNAETECIKRIRNAANAIGIQCLEIFEDGRFVHNSSERVSRNNVDFVISLHFDTPKCYDAFSFVALWNPVAFYHESGYSRCSRNIITHDDFLSCRSNAADDHVRRMLRKSDTHMPPHFCMFHSVAEIVHKPSIGDGKLFYIGINWEALSGRQTRHQALLKRLDNTGRLRIYGPKVFRGLHVWDGYKSYVEELPFDGISVINEISKAGATLVLSSKAHKESSLMSSRLFETIAAGTLAICDENNFAKEFFGDCLLYIDNRVSENQIEKDILRHLDWVQTHQEEALAMIARAQHIFRRKFSLIQNIKDLYGGLQARKDELLQKTTPRTHSPVTVRLYLLMPEFLKAVLQAHLNSVSAQDYLHFSPTLVANKFYEHTHRQCIEDFLARSPVPMDVVFINYDETSLCKNLKNQRKFGSIVLELTHMASKEDAFIVVGPNENIFSNHISVLAGSLQRNPGARCASTAVIITNGLQPVKEVHDSINFANINMALPIGFGRFIFRTSSIDADIDCVLPYLHGRAFAVLVGDCNIYQNYSATIVINPEHPFPGPPYDETSESEAILDYSSDALKERTEKWQKRPFQPRSYLKILFFFKRLTNLKWVKEQICALHKQGVKARWQIFKDRAGR